MTQKDQKGSMITVTLTNQFRTLCAHVSGCVHVFDFCHDWTKYYISDDGYKGVQICISPTFIEPSVYQGIKVWHASMLDVR